MKYMEKFGLDGKTAVVCGGMGLIGKETSIALAQAGAKVICLDQKEGDLGNGIITEKFDVTKSQEIEEIWNKHGPIHIWVNTAYPRTEDWGKEEVKSWSENVEKQMNSVCLITLKIVELMKKDEIKGSIINLGSIYGVVGSSFEIYEDNKINPTPAAYAAIKGGVLNFSRHCASKYGKEGIRINCVCPGGVFNNQDDKFVSNYNERTPLKRMAKPEEVASPILFLSSDASSYITGTTFMVDGGWTCR